MKEIRTEDAVGTFYAMTSHRLSKMLKKGCFLRKVILSEEEDIPLLLSVGKEHLYVWEKKERNPS